MNKTITISYDEDKLNALKIYLEKKSKSIEGELEQSLDALYTKTVPVLVREYVDLNSNKIQKTDTKTKKSKPVPPIISDDKETKKTE